MIVDPRAARFGLSRPDDAGEVPATNQCCECCDIAALAGIAGPSLANGECKIMQEKKNWWTQEKVDLELDRIAADGTATIEGINPYQAAKQLGAEPNSSFYEKVRSWKKRRLAETATPVLEVPPAIEAEYRSILDEFATRMLASFLTTVGRLGGEIDHAATLRVTDAQQRLARAQSEIDELVKSWTETEYECDDARARVAELERALREANARIQRLVGRLEERSKLLEAQSPLGVECAAENSDPIGMLVPDVKNVRDRDQAKMSPDVSSEVIVREGVEGATQTQPLASERDLLPAGPRELPLVSKERADEA